MTYSFYSLYYAFCQVSFDTKIFKIYQEIKMLQGLEQSIISVTTQILSYIVLLLDNEINITYLVSSVFIFCRTPLGYYAEGMHAHFKEN